MPKFLYRPKDPNADENGFVDATIASPKDSDDPRFYVISDSMPDTRHMATGRYFSSKSEFRKETKASGCIEYGNDAALLRPRKPIPLDRQKRRDDIRQTVYNLRNGIKDVNNG